MNIFNKKGSAEISKPTTDIGGIKIPNIDLEGAYRNLPPLNVMVCGKTGVGKSTLINAIFPDADIDSGVGEPITEDIEKYNTYGSPLNIFDCPGFELDNAQREKVMRQIESTVKEHHIHCIWYCINVMGSRVEKPEAECIKQLSHITIPNGENGYKNLAVVIVMTQSYVQDRVNGLIDTLKNKCGLKHFSIVDVVAKEENLNGALIPQYGLDKLIDVTAEKMPIGEGVQETLIAKQMVNLKQKEKKSTKIVIAAALAAFTIGFVPIPAADAPILAAAEVAMIARITVIYGLDIKKSTLTTLVSSVLGVGGASILGKNIVSWILKMTGVGHWLGGAIAGTTALALTAALGEAYIQLMNQVFKGKIKPENIGNEGKEILGELFKSAMKNKGDIYKEIKRNLKKH